VSVVCRLEYLANGEIRKVDAVPLPGSEGRKRRADLQRRAGPRLFLVDEFLHNHFAADGT